MRAPLLGVIVAGLSACIEPSGSPDAGAPDAGGSDAATPDAGPPLAPVHNRARGIDDTALSIDLAAHTAVAVVTFEGSADAGATLDVGDLSFDDVLLDGGALAYALGSSQLSLALPPSSGPVRVELRYRWVDHEQFMGASSGGYTLTWPYYCGNVFPCHAQPADGTTFSLALTGIPAGRTAVYAARIATEAPAYQLAWTVAEYTELPLGRTDAGTELVAWYRPGEEQPMRTGTEHLRAVFDWYEHTLGPYRFGARAGPATANWGALNGGMEHHPFWHLGAPALPSHDVQAHEAAHGWFGDGVRLACWEDLVLSEGTATYLAARALEVVAPARGAEIWAANATELMGLSGAALVWPEGCGGIDVLTSGLFSRAPYLRGAFFFRAVALKAGAEQLDAALSAFYAANAGKAATMDALLGTLHTVTGFDPHACAAKWLRSATIPSPGPCD